MDLSEAFHSFACEWTEGEVVFTFDDRIVSRGAVPASFDRPMYLLINLAVGGNWYRDEMRNAGTPYAPWEVDEASMPWKMHVDYVRVYQADSASASE